MELVIIVTVAGLWGIHALHQRRQRRREATANGGVARHHTCHHCVKYTMPEVFSKEAEQLSSVNWTNGAEFGDGDYGKGAAGGGGDDAAAAPTAAAKPKRRSRWRRSGKSKAAAKEAAAEPPAARVRIRQDGRHQVEGHIAYNVTECPVCLDGFQAGQELLLLPCLHAFHLVCAEGWVATHGTCPVDRRDLDKAATELRDKHQGMLSECRAELTASARRRRRRRAADAAVADAAVAAYAREAPPV